MYAHMCIQYKPWIINGIPDKARVNRRKHAVDFADAAGVFEDTLALTIDDAGSPEEPRWITLGTDFGGRLLVVVYTYQRRGHPLNLRPKGDKKRARLL